MYAYLVNKTVHFVHLPLLALVAKLVFKLITQLKVIAPVENINSDIVMAIVKVVLKMDVVFAVI